MPRKANPNNTPTVAAQRKTTMKAIREAYTGDDIASALFRKACEIDEDIRHMYELREANRQSLRNLATQGLVNADDVAAVYPVKKDKETPDTPAPADTPAAA